MKKQRLLVTAAAIIFTITAFGSSAAAQSTWVLSEAQRITGDKFAISTRTPMGANVYAVNTPSTSVLDAVDKGLVDLFTVAKKNGYFRRLRFSDYSIYIALADRTTDYQGQYSPDIAIAPAQYAGTIFDKGGYMYAAGMVIAYDPCSFIIAEHTKDLDRISNVVRYEGEHIVLYHNDRARYTATADHSKGGSHPILQ